MKPYMPSPELKSSPSTGPNCWTASLGDCSDNISHEHILSKGLFGDDEVRSKIRSTGSLPFIDGPSDFHCVPSSGWKQFPRNVAIFLGAV